MSENTDYTIKVKAIDSIGRESNVYETTVRTDTYKLPKISVSTSATENSITVKVNATPGDGSIVSYHYSRDDGSNYTSSPNNSYTFDGLTSGTTYYLKVYVTDSNGRTSAVTSKTQATTYVNPSVSRVTASNITSDSVTINVTASGGTNNISRYYYSSNNGASWVNSTSSSYTFTGLSAGTKYNFKVYVKDTAGHSSSQKSVSATTEDNTFASYIKDLYTSDGVNGIYYHNSSLTNGAGDNSYRYSGANPNNYVCFGSTAATCPNDNLYRIIGVFDNQVKLIKSTSYGEYAWDSSYSNDWSSSDINNTLNSTYLNSLGSTWRSKIATHTWYVGGHTTYIATAKKFYNAESSGTTWNGKVGLMYVSDYGYAANSNAWSDYLRDYNDYSSTNWLFLGSSEWTIAPDSSGSYSVFSVNLSGGLANSTANLGYSARPVFYLNSNVALENGTGSSSDPYRLAV